MVLNNRDLNQVTWEQRAMAGDPKFEASQQVPDFPYARYAEMLDLGGIRVDNPDQLGNAWEQAFAANRPVLIECYADPNVPPLPPHITLKQARAFASSLWNEPERSSVLVNTAREVLSSVLPGKE